MNKAVKNFDILATSSSVLHNYFDIDQQNYFSDLYPSKILDFSAKFFFSRQNDYAKSGRPILALI